MFEEIGGEGVPRLTSADLAAFVDRLAGLSTDVPDAERIDVIGWLESVKAATGAAQARMTTAFDRSQRAEQAAAGVPARRLGAGIPAQVGLARRESPARAARYTGWAKVLVEELPCTFAALERGKITEWRAMIVARETIWLSAVDRAVLDAELAEQLPGLGDRQVETEARKLAYRLDPHGFLARSRTAERDRRVSLRPAPDTMARLTALLPCAQGVAAYAALTRAADAARAAGDERGRGQVMADTLVERITGQSTADGVPVEVELIMTDHTLFNTATGHRRSPRAANRAHRGDDAETADRPVAAFGTVDVDDAETANSAKTANGAEDVDDAGTADSAETPDDAETGYSGQDTYGAEVVDDAGTADSAETPDDAETGYSGQDTYGAEAVDDAESTDEATGSAGQDGASEPAHLVGYGPIPAGLARDLAAGTDDATVWVRRLVADPVTGRLVALDIRRRRFERHIRRAIVIRDQLCRTPWCGAPIRHTDHARSVADDGETTFENGQGLCEACNYAKDAHGWSTEPGPGGTSQSVIITTPTGHVYTSRPPDLPGTRVSPATGQRVGPEPPAVTSARFRADLRWYVRDAQRDHRLSDVEYASG